MKIYTMHADVDDYWYAFPKGVDREDFWRQFDGQSLIKNWSMQDFEWSKGENDDPRLGKQRYGKGDIQGYQSHIPLLSKRAVECLKEFLSLNGEILKINVLEEEDIYFLYNITNIKDALDTDKSDIKYFRDSDRIMRIKKYEFKKDVIENIHIFNLPAPRYKSPFVSEDFVIEVEKCGLKGFKFNLVWEG